MALFQGIQEYIALDTNNITLVFDSGNIVSISGNIFLYPLKAIQYYVIMTPTYSVSLKVSVTVRGVGMFMRLFEKSYKV